GTYLIGTNGAGLLRFDGTKVVKVYRKEDGLPANHIGTLLRRKKDGALWIATYGGGLALFEKGAFRSFGREEGLADLSLMALWEDEHGDLFVGTNGGGLLRFQDGRFARIGRAQGLPDDNVFAILEGEPGVVYLTSNAGIFRVSRADLDAVAEKRLDKLPLEIYGLADGLLSVRGTGGSLPQAARAANGTLWFATVRGAAVLDPAKHPPRAAPPNVVVEDARVDGVARPLADLSLESGPRTLEIAYTAFGFRAPSRMHFRYRLEGWDPDWVDAGSRRTAFYTGLPPGRYRFRVLAANADGVWNEKGASVEVEVTPRPFETWAFRGAVLALGVGLSVLFGALVQRARTKGLRARQHALQEEVERRTRALREANEKLVRLNDGKNEFLGIAAHDLQNPLTAVSGFATILREQPDLPAHERDSLLARIASASARMSALVKNLLEVNALERGSVTAKLQDVDAIAVVRDVAELFRPRAEIKRQPLLVEATSLPLLCRADPALLHEVLENLVSNAIKYSQPGRPVRLAVRRVAARVRIEVEDQGPGLTEEDRERLFQPFARLSARPTAGEPSTGLGLSIVKRLVEVMEGTITCKSAPGRGTTFTVELPVSP
ncbi:MAG: hypothetical protein JNK60_13610, partial [Acidobacteria bacterium]|nr:hypothetical protein [Acidobacteriota bacterium]